MAKPDPAALSQEEHRIALSVQNIFAYLLQPWHGFDGP
jgi:hypothetical protein